RDGKNVGAVSVDYTTVANTAIAGSDYTTTSGTLNWSDGDAATKTIIVPLSDDTTQENLETFSVQLSNPIGTSIGDATATVYVYDDDSSIRVVNTIIGYREDAGNAIIAVARDGKNVGAVSVDYTTVANTAIAGSDYTTTSGTLNWSDGDATPKTITVPIINDITLESLENFTVQLSNPIGTSIGDAIATIYIYNDDSTVRLYNTVYGIAENGTSINIIVKRDAHRIGAISVDYTTVAGTALAASDYTTTSGTLNWSDGDSTDKIITVNITNDGTAESLEYFDVQLSNPIGTSITTATSRVYIYNDD
ncbi:MAG: aggregation factor core protein MAFp3, isoform C, partial [Gammaproteobacteria bacterium]|nr:aggregation factor core protein MAFp3, isoform C [Gammaproteobacteria bacterium]